MPPPTASTSRPSTSRSRSSSKGLDIGLNAGQSAVADAVKGVLPDWAAAAFDTASGAATKGISGALESGAWNSGEGRKAFLGAVVESLAERVGADVVASTYVLQTQTDVDVAAARARALAGGPNVQPDFAATLARASETSNRLSEALALSDALGETANSWGPSRTFLNSSGGLHGPDRDGSGGHRPRGLDGPRFGAMVDHFLTLYETAETDVPALVGLSSETPRAEAEAAGLRCGNVGAAHVRRRWGRRPA